MAINEKELPLKQSLIMPKAIWPIFIAALANGLGGKPK